MADLSMLPGGRGRPPAPTGDVRADAMHELRWAMAGPGLTLDKLGLMESVLSLPVVAAAMQRADGVPLLLAAYDTICEAARRLGNALHQRVLRNALGIDYDGDAKDLTMRRKEFVRRHNDSEHTDGNVIGESPRTLYDIETRMLDALVTVLGAGSTAAALTSTGQRTSDETWDVDVFEVTLRFAGRSARMAELVDVVVARQDGLSAYQRTYYCTTDSGKPARLEVLEGGRVAEDKPVGRENFRTATIAFPEPLRAGAHHRIRSNVTYPPRRGESEPWLVLQVIRPYRRVVVRLTFEPDCLPASIWRVDGVLPEARGGDPASSLPLRTDPFGCVETEFADPHLSRCYGVAWQW